MKKYTSFSLEDSLRRCEAWHVQVTEGNMYFRKTIPKQRTEQIQFLVGEVVHFQENVTYTGVIIGWSKNYERHAALRSKPLYRYGKKLVDWYNDLLVQPFYTIMTDEFIKYYVPQVAIKNIVKNTSTFFKNSGASFELRPTYSRLGQYFCRLEDTYCVPNHMLANHYPDDCEMLRVKYADESGQSDVNI